MVASPPTPPLAPPPSRPPPKPSLLAVASIASIVLGAVFQQIDSPFMRGMIACLALVGAGLFGWLAWHHWKHDEG